MLKKNRVILILLSAIMIFVSSAFISLCQDSKITISIERIDYSIRDSENKVIAKIYYDKPVIDGDSEAGERINKFFDKEADGWFNGKNRLTLYEENRLNEFKIAVEEGYERWGNDMEVQPFLYTVDTKVTLQSDNLLSIMQIATYQTGGPRDWHYFGSTFDLSTGELLSIDKIIKSDTDRLQDMVVSYLLERQDLIDCNSESELKKKLYGSEEPNQWKYEYFLDQGHSYLILNKGIFSDSGCIMKWNGKFNDSFEASLIGYITGPDGNINQITY